MEQGRNWLEKLPNFHQQQLRHISGFLLQQCYSQLDVWDGPKDFVLVPPSAVDVCCLCALVNAKIYKIPAAFPTVSIPLLFRQDCVNPNRKAVLCTYLSLLLFAFVDAYLMDFFFL